MEYSELKKEFERQKPQMTNAERSAAYNEGKEIDFIPFETMNELAMCNILGYTYFQMSNDVEVMADIIRKKREWFGEEGIGANLTLRGIGAALGSELYFPENGVDRVQNYVLQDYRDFDKLVLGNPRTNPVLAPKLERAKQLKNIFPEMSISTSFAGPFTTAASIRPLEYLLRDTRKNPKMLRKLLQLTIDASLAWLKIFCEEFGPSFVTVSDPVTCTDILSKKQFNEISLPFLRQMIEGIVKITGIEPCLHICGHTREIWDEISTLPISCFSVDNCEKMEEAKKVFGNKMMITGNVPPVSVMMYGTIDEVIESCIQCIKEASDSPMGYQLWTGCQVPIGTPKQNLEAFVYAARKYGSGARRGKICKGVENLDKMISQR